MKKATKILSIVMVIAMMASMFVLGAEAATYQNGDVLYRNDFSNFDVATLNLEGFAVASGAHTTLEIKDGALHLVGNEWAADNSVKIGGRYGARAVLYDIPEDVDKYTVSADVYINEYLANTSSCGPSILLTYNGIADPNATEVKGEFAMMWLRIFDKGTTGYYQYGETGSNVVDKSQGGFCVPGTWYNVQFYADLADADGPTGAFKITNKSTGDVFEAEEIIFNTLGHNNIVGIYNNVADVLYDNISVTYGDAYFGKTVPMPEETTKNEETTAAPTEETTPKAEETTLKTEESTGEVDPSPTGDMGMFVWVALAAVAAIAVASTALYEKKRSVR